ncbi:DNA translocase FtsK [Brevibacillus laterosporus]
MYLTIIEGTVEEFETIEDVIDHIQSNVYFEVDQTALRWKLEHMNLNESVKLRNDCMVVKCLNQDEIKERADQMFEKVANQARKNGSVSISWVQNVFRLDYYTSATIVDRMEDEKICERYKGKVIERLSDRDIILKESS